MRCHDPPDRQLCFAYGGKEPGRSRRSTFFSSGRGVEQKSIDADVFEAHVGRVSTVLDDACGHDAVTPEGRVVIRAPTDVEAFRRLAGLGHLETVVPDDAHAFTLRAVGAAMSGVFRRTDARLDGLDAVDVPNAAACIAGFFRFGGGPFDLRGELGATRARFAV